MKKLLIISNNVLSEINNNGKTILSFIENAEIEIRQLYFSSEIPVIDKYKYFRISDNDIIRGYFSKKKRGRRVSVEKKNEIFSEVSLKKKFGRNLVTLYIRELLWKNRWKSRQLDEWLDEFKPNAILFVAGDSVFAYDICFYIKEKYDARLTTYVTDDYVMPRLNEGLLGKFRRSAIRKQLGKILKITDVFYTISEQMQSDYQKEFMKKSQIAMNMSDDLQDKSATLYSDKFIFIYTGSLYYGRDNILATLAQSIKNYNTSHEKKAFLEIYCGTEPEDTVLEKINIDGNSQYMGALDKQGLRDRLNKSDILVFVESFEREQIEKTKYSLSTKIPEYLSVSKPILAIGPNEIGSMLYLKDVAMCVNNIKELNECIRKLLNDERLREEYAFKSRQKYEKKHDRKFLQREFIKNVVGD